MTDKLRNLLAGLIEIRCAGQSRNPVSSQISTFKRDHCTGKAVEGQKRDLIRHKRLQRKLKVETDEEEAKNIGS